MILIPAYGRVYGSDLECLTDWESGKDFKIKGGPYCSIRDFEFMKKDFNEIVIQWSKTEPTMVLYTKNLLDRLINFTEIT